MQFCSISALESFSRHGASRGPSARAVPLVSVKGYFTYNRLCCKLRQTQLVYLLLQTKKISILLYSRTGCNLIKLEAMGQCIPPPRHGFPVSRSPPKFNHLFTGPLPTFPEFFYANRFGSFCAKLLTDRQTDKQRRLAYEATHPPRQR